MTAIKVAKRLLWIGILAALALPAFAETRTISWNPVTTYTDGTPIEAGKTVRYSAYWTTDPGLGSLRTIGTSLSTTSTTFDPGVQGMTRGGTVYFTAKDVLNTGEESALSPALSWVVPIVTPPVVTLTGIAVSGPSSVNEGGTGTYTATATWSDGTTTSVTPSWSENSTYATISTGGVLTTSAVTSNQAVTVTASYTSGGVTRTATRPVTVVNASATLTGIAVSGPSSVNEGGTGTYTATATWSDSSTTSVTPTWSTTLGTISAAGLFTAPSVTANQTATVTASYTSGGVTRTATRPVTVVNASATLTGIAVSGPSSVNEGGTGTYTATATWSDSSTTSVTPTWSTTLGTISAAGLFTAPSVTANQTATVTASYTSGGVTRTATRPVTVVNASATLTGIAVSGPSSVNEGGTGTYTATGTWDNGTTAAISPTWSVSASYATIGVDGALTASTVTANQTVTVTASYGGRTGTMSVTIVDAPGTVPAEAKNIGITGPISSGGTQVWRLTWDPVTTYANDVPLEAGRTVQYMAYWTDDPALSAASLKQLSSADSAPALDFDPTGRMMAKNQKTYLTVRAILDTGEVSPLSAALPWVAANDGPTAPSGGSVKKKDM